VNCFFVNPDYSIRKQNARNGNEEFCYFDKFCSNQFSSLSDMLASETEENQEDEFHEADFHNGSLDVLPAAGYAAG
jgi:hypothetical protein